MKVALVNMPFSSLYRPSIGLSLLQTALQKRTISCDTHYLNLMFGKMVGVPHYNRICESGGLPTAAFSGEWIFSQSLYGYDNFDEYMAYLDRSFFDDGCDPKRDQIAEYLLTVREHVEPFLERALHEVDWGSYDIIGFTSVFEQNVACLSLAKRIKQRWPNAFIIFGGANCEGEMGQGLLQEFPFVDAVCSGEGDISFISFVEQMVEMQGDPSKCHSPGISLQAKYLTELPLIPVSSPSVHDMNSLPYPNYDDYFAQFKEAGLLGQELLPRFLFESSRGCWWGAKSHCLFCGLNGSNLSYRSKTADRALEELLFLRERYKEYTNKADAVDNIIDMSYFRDFLPVIRDMQLDLDMFYETKANLTKEQIKLFHEAGFHYIQPGIESMITSVLRLMRKGVSMLQNVQLLKWAKEFGVKPLWNFLYGFPGENEEEYHKVLDVVRSLTHLDPPGATGSIRLDRFSPYYNQAAEYGIVNIRPMHAFGLVYQEQSVETLMKLAYHFEFDYETAQDPSSYTHGLVQEVKVWKEQHSQSEFFSVDTGDHLILVDLRPVTTGQHLRTLTGLEKTLFQFCDNLRSYKTIYEHLEKEGIEHTQDGVQAILNRFVEEKMMLTEAGVYLNVAIPLGNYTPKKHGLERLLQFQQSEAWKEAGATSVI